jgi:hypothetical protein
MLRGRKRNARERAGKESTMGNQFDDERQRRRGGEEWAGEEPVNSDRPRRDEYLQQAYDRERDERDRARERYAGRAPYAGQRYDTTGQYASGPYAGSAERRDERHDDRDWRRSSLGLAREGRDWDRNFQGRDPRSREPGYEESRFGMRGSEWSDPRDPEALRLDRFGRSPDRWPYDPSSAPADWRHRQPWQGHGGDFRNDDPFQNRQGYDPRRYAVRDDEPQVWTDIKRGARRLFRGLKGYTRSDDRIREDVCDRINDAGERIDADVSDVEVRVQNGEVTLSGVIRDRRQKHVVENAADSVGGVKDVHNLLRVRRDDEPEPISRAEHNGPQATARGATGSTVNRPGSA